jgi:hypothetical protein
MSAIVKSAEATLKTLSVTIQSLSVNSKQMTLAVFRQLPELTIHTDEGKLLDGITLWGCVRYAIKDSASFWIVCQKDDILYRAALPSKYHRDGPYKCPIKSGTFLKKGSKYGERRYADYAFDKHKAICHQLEESLKNDSTTTHFSVPNILNDEGKCALWYDPKHSLEYPVYLSKEEAKTFLVHYQKAIAELDKFIAGMLKAEQELSDRVDALRTTLQNLPQLFIAV